MFHFVQLKPTRAIQRGKKVHAFAFSVPDIKTLEVVKKKQKKQKTLIRKCFPRYADNITYHLTVFPVNKDTL